MRSQLGRRGAEDQSPFTGIGAWTSSVSPEELTSSGGIPTEDDPAAGGQVGQLGDIDRFRRAMTRGPHPRTASILSRSQCAIGITLRTLPRCC
jgi:hypothetical protein